jgi:hypothetical protein
VSPVQ